MRIGYWIVKVQIEWDVDCCFGKNEIVLVAYE
jgi:hypothetical protein